MLKLNPLIPPLLLALSITAALIRDDDLAELLGLDLDQIHLLISSPQARKPLASLFAVLPVTVILGAVNDNLSRTYYSLVALTQALLFYSSSSSVVAHLASSIILFFFIQIYKTTLTAIVLRRWRSEIKLAESSAAPRSNTKRIMILYANVGSGHKSAANAVSEALTREGGDGQVEIMKVDMMELASPAFKFVMQTMFQKLTQSLIGQHTLGYLYDMGDGGNQKRPLQRAMEDAAGVTLVKEIAKFKPHTIICTHFLPAQLVASIKKASKVLQNEIRLGLVITDLDLQSMWVQPGAVDVYYLPRDDSAVVLRDYERRAEEKRKKAGKVQSKVQSKVVVSGIPIAPRFADAVEKKTNGDLDAGFEMFNLKRADPRPVVVIMSGGVGIEELYKLCLKAKRGCQFVVVMGRQADVRKVLTAVEVPSKHSVELVGFCKEMPTLLSIADLMVGKCGGLTAAENAALTVPILILDPIPGQEQRNADVLLETGGCLKINDLPLIPTRLDYIFENEKVKLEEMKKGMAKLAKPLSAFTIAGEILQA
ncbi:hypothetical protein TrLO_g12486 [Triparma laevis f. longispina]|uniref:monogalactosyldiacylglycerol synthase n=1 Tax=Triparma laevis f. longispina TaxID=1714387 RepID=A0A9W7FQW7_9STRA|nr:hypothetical protein TrLO_g12486 [Triparma laevis f. longispina]